VVVQGLIGQAHEAVVGMVSDVQHGGPLRAHCLRVNDPVQGGAQQRS
jgi:hypothetical protein